MYTEVQSAHGILHMYLHCVNRSTKYTYKYTIHMAVQGTHSNTERILKYKTACMYTAYTEIVHIVVHCTQGEVHTFSLRRYGAL